MADTSVRQPPHGCFTRGEGAEGWNIRWAKKVPKRANKSKETLPTAF